MPATVTRVGTTFTLNTRAGQATVNTLVPYEDRVTSNVTRWDVRLTLSSGGVTLAEDFTVTPESPFKPLAKYIKLDLLRVLEKLALSSEVEQYVGRFETAYAAPANGAFLVSNLPD